ncbi:hypothetical protein L1049_001498 [Liquidambar formosana]|uniref:Uncharacterized protein n=1 Tax=Liquidambar formosana TaxID=63359 RepID=A0AAP0NDE1_LIQFO
MIHQMVFGLVNSLHYWFSIFSMSFSLNFLSDDCFLSFLHIMQDLTNSGDGNHAPFPFPTFKLILGRVVKSSAPSTEGDNAPLFSPHDFNAPPPNMLSAALIYSLLIYPILYYAYSLFKGKSLMNVADLNN